MYVGRFAPSPSGPLHMGSLVCALASYLDAKAHDGQWLIRIEDLDTPRCDPKYTRSIQQTLENHGMVSDRPILIQSNRTTNYQRAVNEMLMVNKAYFCMCTRKAIRANKGVHSSNCKLQQYKQGAIRYINDSPFLSFEDRFRGTVTILESISGNFSEANSNLHALEDFTLLRKDGIFAYNLAVVIDDIAQNISHIVRGDDLLTTTSAHLSLYRHFNIRPPVYGHIKVVKDTSGLKLSKQNHAPPIDDRIPATNLRMACKHLGIDVGNTAKRPEHILESAMSEWRYAQCHT